MRLLFYHLNYTTIVSIPDLLYRNSRHIWLRVGSVYLHLFREFGTPSGTWTHIDLIKSQELYHLSYRRIVWCVTRESNPQNSVSKTDTYAYSVNHALFIASVPCLPPLAFSYRLKIKESNLWVWICCKDTFANLVGRVGIEPTVPWLKVRCFCPI